MRFSLEHSSWRKQSQNMTLKGCLRVQEQGYYSKQDSVPVPTYRPVSLFFPVSVAHRPCLHYIIAMTGFEVLN